MTLKQALWEIVRDENIIITNQNIDWLLDRAEKRANDNTDKNKLKCSILERKEKLDKLGESELLINQNKSNNFEVKSNNSQCIDCIHNDICQFYKALGATVICYPCGFYEAKSNEELFKQALVEGVSMRIDNTISTPQWISVKDRLPETKAKQITICDQDIQSGEVTSKVVVEAQVSNTVVVVGKRHLYGKFEQYLDLDNTVDGRWANNECVTHWMPLPEAPKMKGGEE